MTYEEMTIEAENSGLKLKEVPLKYGLKGLYKNGKIIIDSRISTNKEKKCILAEEIGHHETTYGNIINLCNTTNTKQECIARLWAYKKLVGLISLIEAYKFGVKNRFEMAEYLEVTEEFLNDAIKYYKEKYGLFYEIDNFIITFEPLGILEKFNDF